MIHTCLSTLIGQKEVSHVTLAQGGTEPRVTPALDDNKSIVKPDSNFFIISLSC